MSLFGWTIQILLLALMSESVPFLSGPEDLVLHGGGSGQLTCTGSNVTSWYNAANDSVTIGNSPNLTVSTSGLYYCRAEHGTTLVRSCPADVSLVTFQEPLSSKSLTMTVHRTNDVILSSCRHVHSIPPPTIIWMFNNSLLPKNTVILPSGSLLIPDLKYSDNLGNYSCVAMNPVTKEEWHSPNTTLERAPSSNKGNVVFQDTPVNVTAVVGESVALECAPAGEVKISVVWTPMPSNSHIYNERYGGVLGIDDVMLSNAGVYNCLYTWSHENYTANGTRQFHLTVQDHPKISDLTVDKSSTTAVLNCSYTGYPTPMIMWHTPSGVITFAEGSTLTITSLGPEAAGVYQCYVTNDIGCDHREINISIPVDHVTSSSASIAFSITDTSSVDFSSSIFSHTPSSIAIIGPIMTSSISPSSVSIGQVSSMIDTSSSVSIGAISSVVSSSVSISLISSVMSSSDSISPISSIIDVSSSSVSVSPSSSVIDASSSSVPFVSSAIIASSASSTSISRPSVTPIDSLIGRTSSSSEVFSPTALSSSIVDSFTDAISPSSAEISHTPSISPSSVFIRTSDVAMVTSHTLSSMVSDMPSSSSSQVSLSSTSSVSILVESSTADHSSIVTDIIATTAIADSSSTTVVVSTAGISPTSSSSSPTPSSSSPTPSSTSYVAPTATVSPTPTVDAPVTMVTGVEFTWVGEDVVKVQWDAVTNENILGYKISWDSKMIESPNPAFTATNMSEFEISLMENVATIYIYIWTYNFAGDGPLTPPTSIVRPITNMKCQNISIFSAHVDWTILSPVSKYQVTAHCSRTGNTVTTEVEGDGTSSMASLLLKSLEPDCIYDITIMPEGYNDYSLKCIIFTAEPIIFVEILKNQSFINGFIIQWKLYNFENIPVDLITMEVQVGSQTWTIGNPLKSQEFVNLSITQEGRTEVNVIITVRNVWTIKKTINVEINEVQPTGGDQPTDQSTVEDDEDDDSLTWIFYVVAFGSVVAVVIFVIATIIILKHVQIRRREFDKITNHREKIMASFKHENTNGRPAVEPPKYIVV